MKSDRRRDFSDIKPQSALSKEMLRIDLNAASSWEKVRFVGSHDLKNVIMVR